MFSALCYWKTFCTATDPTVCGPVSPSLQTVVNVPEGLAFPLIRDFPDWFDFQAFSFPLMGVLFYYGHICTLFYRKRFCKISSISLMVLSHTLGRSVKFISCISYFLSSKEKKERERVRCLSFSPSCKTPSLNFSEHVAILISFKSALFELYSIFCFSALERVNKESSLSSFIFAFSFLTCVILFSWIC